jgi:Ser/Thr protein kinase RdoA (MazF antagonist)
MCSCQLRIIGWVLPIGELVEVARTVGDDGSSPLALRVARPWGCEQARFLRSSANHVFICENGVLRFRPQEAGSMLGRAVEATSRLVDAGVAVAAPVSSRGGDLAVLVEVDSRRYVATMSVAVAGRQVGEESLTPELARAWGGALARFHDAAATLEPPPSIPSWLSVVAEAAQTVGDDQIVDQLRALPFSDEVAGLVHGDPELDNVIWNETGEPVFVDLDDLSRSWFAADTCFALRDFEGSPLADDFVGGYRDHRPLTDEELSWLPLFRRAHALVTLAGLEHILAEPAAEDWPDWAAQLRTRLEDVAARLRVTLD